MDDKSLADSICQELVNGLKTGDLDWTHFIAKHGASKGLLYNAIGRFFRDMESEARAINEAQARTADAKKQLKPLNQKIDEADRAIKEKGQEITRLEKKQSALKKKSEALEGKVVEDNGTLERLRELEKLGFGKDRLDALHTTISDIGSKRELTPAEAVDAFFADLTDYDAKSGFRQELQRLSSAMEAARLEADKWGTEARTYEKKHEDLQRTIDAVHSLKEKGVKPGQVISWNSALASVGGVEELEACLERYGSVRKVLAALRKEQQQLEARIVEARAVVKTLTEQQAELEASITAIRESVIAEIEQVSARGVQEVTGVTKSACDSIEQAGKTASTELKETRASIDEVAACSISSIGKMGETALGQLKEAVSLVDQVSAKALEVSATVDQAVAKLAKSKKLKYDTERLVAGIERVR